METLVLICAVEALTPCKSTALSSQYSVCLCLLLALGP